MAGKRGGSTGEEVDDDDGVMVAPAIRVNQARQLFGVKGDEILAKKLQDEEFQEKYSWNREVRQTARKDVPLARATYDEEEERQQRERLEFLQEQTRIAGEDAKLARQYQKEEQLEKERKKLRQEVLDQELAKRIQVEEIQEQCRPEVRRTRDTENDGRDGRGHPLLSSDGHPIGGRVIQMSHFAGFHSPSATDDDVDDDDGLTEEERKQLMLLQDEELALALQEHEKLRALRCGRSQTRVRFLTEDQLARPIVLLVPQVQQKVPQLTAAPIHPDVQSRQGSVRGAGVTPTFHQTRHQSPQGPPTYQAPRAPVHHVTQTQTDRSTNDVSDRSVTLVTSVGNSEFFRTIPAAEGTSREPNCQPRSTRETTRNDSPAEINRRHTVHPNRESSTQESSKNVTYSKCKKR